MKVKMPHLEEITCSAKPALALRPLLTPKQAAETAAVFKVLANDTRLRLLHALVQTGERCVAEIAEALNMKTPAVSNQLQRLVDRGILGFRRQGLKIYYRIEDPCVISILDHGLCLTEDARERRK